MNPYELHCIAGDDLAVAVDFTADGQALALEEGDRVELVLHYPNGTDKLIAPVQQKDNTVTFVLTTEQTLELLAQNPSGKFRYCVRLYWANGRRYTPIHRELLVIARC